MSSATPSVGPESTSLTVFDSLTHSNQPKTQANPHYETIYCIYIDAKRFYSDFYWILGFAVASVLMRLFDTANAEPHGKLLSNLDIVFSQVEHLILNSGLSPDCCWLEAFRRHLYDAVSCRGN